ncbi:phenylalanine--tRNA ligase subunit beta [Methanofervidicoccus sp. A16]|uniref:phenylalanine--tRNA ligase subunit beta n=1 Tax=Methanofervidicoccus sp. A16 TaxID=2607662 RepID=UPI001188F01E|nr:phenylalanine--tRNA ligase subunit beta [Methanofervidicoccus sp. A16]AXI24752.1 phenylalanine--tRNA ligase subunit beta [Methanofervidicoccus sp. A16]
MPTVKVVKRDLEKLVNISLSDRTVEEKFPMMGVEVEGIFEEVKDGRREKVIQFSVNPNRPDYLSVEGLARGFRGFIGIEVGMPRYQVYPSDVEVFVEGVSSRPYCAFAIVKNLNIDSYLLESLIDLQEKLHWTIGRDRKKVAIGIHDLDKVSPPFYYKEVSGDEVKFEPLGWDREMTPREILEKHEKGIKYRHLISGDRYPLIVDRDGNVLSMPPIINGNLTKVTTETRNLLIDVTGTEIHSVESTLNIILCALADRGGNIHSVKLNIKGEDGKYHSKVYPDLTPQTYEVSVDLVNKRLGLNLNPGEIINALRKGRMEGEYNYERNSIAVQVPPYRVDILQEVDLIEEVAINYGYDRFTGTLPEVLTVGEKHPLEKKLEYIRSIMIGHGFYEVVNLTLSNEEVLFKRMNIEVGERDYVEVLKPASIEHRVVRTWILPLLLETLYINKINELPQRIFEVGDVVVVDGEGSCRNITKLAFVITHPSANFNEVKSYGESVLRELNIEYKLENYNHPSFIPGRCAKIVDLRDNRVIGYFGEIHPQVILNFQLEYPVVGFEMEVR